MLKNNILFLTILIITNSISAEPCPSIENLKNNIFNNWQPYDLDNGEPLTESERNTFKKNLKNFAYAAWLDSAPEGSAECYYDDLSIYLAKQNLIPDTDANHWHSEGNGLMICQLNREQCQFKG